MDSASQAYMAALIVRHQEQDELTTQCTFSTWCMNQKRERVEKLNREEMEKYASERGYTFRCTRVLESRPPKYVYELRKESNK